jgi:hypothetical protein
MKPDCTQQRSYGSYTYQSIDIALDEAIRKNNAHVDSDEPNKEKRLGSQSFKSIKEQWSAVLFLHCLQLKFKTEIYVAFEEAADYDCIALFLINHERLFIPIQIKRLPSEKINKAVELKCELKKLKKYNNPNLTIAYHISREISLDYKDYAPIKDINVGSIWFFGSCDKDNQSLFLMGNMLSADCAVEKHPSFFKIEV